MSADAIDTARAAARATFRAYLAHTADCFRHGINVHCEMCADLDSDARVAMHQLSTMRGTALAKRAGASACA